MPADGAAIGNRDMGFGYGFRKSEFIEVKWKEKLKKATNFHTPKPRRGDVYQPMVQPSELEEVKRQKNENYIEVKAPQGRYLNNPGILSRGIKELPFLCRICRTQ